MSDIIRLLPDALANQIAAGEVVQRPASAVKELLENAVDAGATDIQLVVKDAGKTLIQVIDNGCGMSGTDARMAFERHATSKIRNIDDLFAIRTFGFRGEALASIAAIAQVELRSRRHEDELGTSIHIEGSEIRKQEPISCPAGTQILVKNLFYNVPARRNFLKKNETEFRNVVEEFLRVALAQPQLALRLQHNGSDLYRLKAGNLRQRIVGVMGDAINSALVPVQEQTQLLQVSGFIGKPAQARKTRGQQYFFVNNRFIRDGYLHHAVMGAFEGLLAEGTHPAYFLYLEVDPRRIDINVHPTKTEIKFEEEQAVYAILQAAVRRALSQYHVAPSLDFERETGLDGIDLSPKAPEDVRPPVIRFNPDYNPFDQKKPASNSPSAARTAVPDGWQDFYQIASAPRQGQIFPATEPVEGDEQPAGEQQLFQLHQRYICSQVKSGLLLVDQNAAHERILYERYLNQQQAVNSQQLLFPENLSLSAHDRLLLEPVLPELQRLGLEIRTGDPWQVTGLPADLQPSQLAILVDELLEQLRQQPHEAIYRSREQLARALSRYGALPVGKSLERPEMNLIIDQLFACEQPHFAPDGRATLVKIPLDEIARRFS